MYNFQRNYSFLIKKKLNIRVIIKLAFKKRTNQYTNNLTIFSSRRQKVVPYVALKRYQQEIA